MPPQPRPTLAAADVRSKSMGMGEWVTPLSRSLSLSAFSVFLIFAGRFCGQAATATSLLIPHADDSAFPFFRSKRRWCQWTRCVTELHLAGDVLRAVDTFLTRMRDLRGHRWRVMTLDCGSKTDASHLHRRVGRLGRRWLVTSSSRIALAFDARTGALLQCPSLRVILTSLRASFEDGGLPHPQKRDRGCGRTEPPPPSRPLPSATTPAGGQPLRRVRQHGGGVSPRRASQVSCASNRVRSTSTGRALSPRAKAVVGKGGGVKSEGGGRCGPPSVGGGGGGGGGRDRAGTFRAVAPVAAPLLRAEAGRPIAESTSPAAWCFAAFVRMDGRRLIPRCDRRPAARFARHLRVARGAPPLAGGNPS
jgi:hypothetical protein